MLNNDIMGLSSLMLFWGTMLNWETIQVDASTINDFLVILGTPWWINGIVKLVCRLVESLCGGYVDGWARREVKPCLCNMERSQCRRYRGSPIMAYLLLNKQRHFKAVKFKYKGWASYPKKIPKSSYTRTREYRFQ
jgi:hypothetical protein